MIGLILQTGLTENVWIALTLFVFVWLFSWAKTNLGSAKLAIRFAVIVVYLTFYSYSILIWIAVALFLFATFGKELFSRVNPFEGSSGGLR